MKSMSDNSLRCLASVLILGMCITVANAGVSSSNEAGAQLFEAAPNDERQRTGAQRELPVPTNKSQRNASRSIIQCWQEGRLIVDERDWEARGQELAGPLFHSQENRYGRLQLMQFGDTFCAVKYRNKNR